MSPKLLLTFAISFFTLFAYAQDFSNKGKDFWIAYPSHIDGVNSVMGIYITSDADASGTIQVGPTATVAFTVTANQVTRKFIGSTGVVDASNTYVLNTQQDGVKTNAAIHIMSDRPVVVYTHIIRSARSGACLALPTPVLGLEYIAPSYSSTGGAGQGVTEIAGVGEIAVVATQPNTVIEVTPTITGRAGRAANVPFQVTLPLPGDVYQFQGAPNADLSGTRIRSISSSTEGCKPVAVFSATTWSAFDCTGASGGDNLLQQLFPTRTWGKQFVTAPFFNRPYDVYRIFVTDATTSVRVTNGGTTQTLPAGSMNAAGKFYQVNTSNPLFIEADKPISVVQYIVSQTCKTGCPTNSTNPACYADPEMVVLSPIEQTLSDITFFSAHRNYVPSGQTQINNHYVNVLINKNYKNSVRIDNAVPNGVFIDIPGTSYSYLQEDVTNSSAVNPVHNIKADTSFSAIVYGYGSVESYGYNGGTNVKDLYQFVTLRNEYASVDFPATCKNTPFNFSITLPYQPISLEWDFSNNANLAPNNKVVNNAPVPDSSFVRDGRTLFVYKLPGTYQFKNKGTYPVKVFANNPTADGCSGIQEINYDVEVYDPPVAKWTANFTGCDKDTVRFADQSQGNGRVVNRWLWNFGDNTTDTVRNPVKYYNRPDTFLVALRSITDIGCIADTVQQLVVSPLPLARFSITGDFCPGSNVPITDTSSVATGSLAKWYWNFGNGVTATQTTNTPTPQVYPAAGNYAVTLQVESAAGCKSAVASRNLLINPVPQPLFNLPGVCLPSGVAMFTNQSTIANNSPMTWLWAFGDGNSDIAANPVHVYTSPGPYQVNLKATSAVGCTKDTTITFNNIFAQPKASFTAAKTTICVTDSVRFTDASTAANNTVQQWRWNFGDGTTSTLQHPVKKWTAGGTYQVSLHIISAAGCVSDTLTQTIKVDSLPTGNFNIVNPACQGKEVTFTDASVANTGAITQWYWNFGDGTNATYANSNLFTKTYAAAGTYTVKLALQTDRGCRGDTLSKNIVIHPQPVAAFLTPEICLSDAFATFTDSSYLLGGNASLSYQWYFGDPAANAGNPNTSIQQHPRHRYGAAANYNMWLKVTTPAGCTDSLAKVFTVNGAVPKSGFVVMDSTTLCSNTQVRIRSTSTVDFGAVTRLEIVWNKLGAPGVVEADASPDNTKIYSHLYPVLQKDTTYLVSVKAYSGISCVSEATQLIRVYASPLVHIATIPGICFDALPRQLATPGNGSVPGSGVWSGTGTSAAGVYTPANAGAGTYTLQYLYTSNRGCRDSAAKTITVWPSPTAVFKQSSPTCVLGAITLTDSSLANANKLTTWTWNDGNGNITSVANGNPQTVRYTNAGQYNVSLQVVTDSGCRSTVATQSLQVHPLPRPGFIVPSVCLPAGTAPFTDTSSIANGTQAQFTYRWNFGDGSASSTQRNPIHRYTATGPYDVKLVVTSVNGCVDSLTKRIATIYPQPKANFTFTPNDTCAGGTFRFTDRTTGANGGIAAWNWSFGGVGSASIQNPSQRFNTAGTYQVRLSVTDQRNCPSDTSVKNITVHPYPTINAGPDLFVLEGGNATIKAIATGSNLQYQWQPASYLNSATAANPVTTPQADITYRVTVTATGGCRATDEVFVKVLKSLGIPNAFSPNGDGINDKWVVQYLESYPGATVEVFNRYGQQVFFSNGYNEPWDGTLKGSPLPVGVYYYIINPKNGRQPYKGSVTILK